jgi:hypothetical protein
MQQQDMSKCRMARFVGFAEVAADSAELTYLRAKPMIPPTAVSNTAAAAAEQVSVSNNSV